MGVISFLAKGKAASAAETLARRRAASVAGRSTWREVGGIQSASTPRVHSRIFLLATKLHKPASPSLAQGSDNRSSESCLTCLSAVACFQPSDCRLCTRPRVCMLYCNDESAWQEEFL